MYIPASVIGGAFYTLKCDIYDLSGNEIGELDALKHYDDSDGLSLYMRIDEANMRP